MNSFLKRNSHYLSESFHIFTMYFIENLLAAEDTIEANEYTLQVALIPFSCICYRSSTFVVIK